MSQPPAPTLTFPQPLGIAPFPQGLLLITDEALRVALLAGVPPETLMADAPAARPSPALREAFAGNVDGSVRLYDAHLAQHPDDALAAYNRFVLDDTGVDVAALKLSLPPEAAALVDIVQFATGAADASPPDDPSLPAEVRAVAGAARASVHVTRGDVAACIEELHASVELVRVASPTLAGVTLDAVSRQYLRQSREDLAVTALEDALSLLAAPEQATLAAASALQLGLCCHQLSLRQPQWAPRAVQAYQKVFTYCDEQSAPETFAAAHVNLASLYLSRPMAHVGDHLRYAVSMQSLKAARRVYQELGDTQQWASATVNLANALVYAPSQHREDNLHQAVDLYDEVLRVRSHDEQPRGYAYTHLNLANALAHLGAFAAAEESLQEAATVFATLEDPEALASLHELQAAIAAAQARVHDPAQAPAPEGAK